MYAYFSRTLQADLADKTTWLQSSNIANTEFYEKHGFFTVGTVVVGENSDSDPTLRWDDRPEPVVVSIVGRSYSSEVSDHVVDDRFKTDDQRTEETRGS